jgi:predicted ATP-dependent protease
MMLAPTKKGEIIAPEEFKELPEQERDRIETRISALQDQLEAIINQVPKWQKELREKIRALNREVTALAVGHLIDERRTKFIGLSALIDHLNAMEQDVIDNVDDFLKSPDESLEQLINIPGSRSRKGSSFSRRYEVNALIDHNGARGAPVIYEDNPTYSNIVGQIEYMSHLGSLVTDFNLIRGGALHRARRLRCSMRLRFFGSLMPGMV